MEFPEDEDNLPRMYQGDSQDDNDGQPPPAMAIDQPYIHNFTNFRPTASRAELVNKMRLTIQRSVHYGLRHALLPHVEALEPELQRNLHLPTSPDALLYELSSSPEPDNDEIPGWTSVQDAVHHLFPIHRYKVVRLLEFNPDDPGVDVEGWCNLTEHIVIKREMSSTELLMSLAQALKGRAASCLTKLKSINNITWPVVKDLLLCTFSRTRCLQDYFEPILTFEIKHLETFANSAKRLWSLIEEIPKVSLPEDIMTGFVISILCTKHAMVNRELRSKVITTKEQLLRALSAISSARRLHPSEVGDRGAGSESAKRSRPGTRYIARCNKCKSVMKLEI